MATNTQTSWRVLLANKGRELSNITTLAGIIIQQDLFNDTTKWREAISKAFIMRNFNFFGEHVYSVLENFDNVDNLLTTEYEAFYHNTTAALKPQITKFNSSVENMKKASLRGHRANDNISDRIWSSALEIIKTFRKFLESLRSLENVSIDSNVTKELKCIINEIAVVFRMWKITGYEEDEPAPSQDIKHSKNKDLENNKDFTSEEFQQFKNCKNCKPEKKLSANKNNGNKKIDDRNKKDKLGTPSVNKNTGTKITGLEKYKKSQSGKIPPLHKNDKKNNPTKNSPAIKSGLKIKDKESIGHYKNKPTMNDECEYSERSSNTKGEDEEGPIILHNNFTSNNETLDEFRKVEYKKSKINKAHKKNVSNEEKMINVLLDNNIEKNNSKTRIQALETPYLPLNIKSENLYEPTLPENRNQNGKGKTNRKVEDLEKYVGEQRVFFTPLLTNNSLRCGLCGIDLYGKEAVTSHLKNKDHLEILFQAIRASIPPSLHFRLGIVKHVPIDFTEEDLNNFTSTVPIISIRRITKRTEAGITPLPVVEIKFQGNILPSEVRYYGIVPCEVEPSTRNLIQCNKCLRFGHTRDFCKSKMKCF